MKPSKDFNNFDKSKTRKYDEKGRDFLAKLCIGVGLDIGCEPKKVTENCIGVDLDETWEPPPDVISDMSELPFDDNSMDFVVSSHCLEHCVELKKTLKEWFRVLTNGGHVGIIVPHGEYAHPKTLGDASCGHHQLFTEKTLSLFLQHIGFENVESIIYERPTAYQQTPGIFAMGVKP